MSSGPELFAVLPSAELKHLLRQSLPPETALAWERLGAFAVTGGKLGVVDAASLHPRYPREIKTLDWPYAAAEAWLQRARTPEAQADRIFAVLLLAPGLRPDPAGPAWELRPGPGMSIDSATAAFGDHARMLSRMAEAGPSSQTCLGRGSAQTPEDRRRREEAARFLLAEGFPVTVETYRTGSLSVRFSPGLSEEQAARANALLVARDETDQVWFPTSHTAGLLRDALAKSLVSHLDDQGGPYLFACHTGFGDGGYGWDSLWEKGRLCGYLCNFVPEPGEGE